MITAQRTIEGMTVVAYCEAWQQQAAADVLTSLERDAVHPIRAGYRFRFGWSMFTLVGDAGALVVCEPDFDGDVLHDVRPRIDVSLDVIVRQVAALRRAGAPPADVRFDDALIVERGALAADDLAMLREAPARAGDSGWRLMRASRSRESLKDADVEGLRVFELLSRRPVALSAAAFPTGYAVVIIGDRVVSVMPPPST